MGTTIGRILINEALPEDMQDPGELDKKSTQSLFQTLAEKHPDAYVDILQRMNNIARLAATEYGDEASLGLKDLRLPKKVLKYRDGIKSKINEITQNPAITSERKNSMIVDMVRKSMPKVQKMLEEEASKEGNAFALSITKGFRGSPVQLTQILYGDQLVADHKNRPVPVAGLHGYAEGVTPGEYWAGSYSSRAAFSGVQFATAKGGYLSKQLAHMSQRLKVTSKDCGLSSDIGVTMTGDDPEIIGHVLQRPVNGIEAGTIINKQHLPKLRGKMPLIRSVSTCQETDGGICQKCAGARQQGKFPPIGQYIGIGSARIIGEPITQAALGTKHTGGVLKAEAKEVEGFDEINQFVQVPKNFRGSSVLAPVDGKVTTIVNAPQGGQYIKVGGEQMYVDKGREIQVKKGDTVEAGDMLTDGTPNPSEIAKYKGLGAGRNYFRQKFYDILKENGASTHMRNVDTLSRAFFDKVKVTNPDGLVGASMGDVISYSDIQRQYKPRDGSSWTAPGRSVGQYLERPVLHYTIGTRITPSVVKRLNDEKIASITVHKDNVGFEPEVIRAMEQPGKDADWRVRLTGSGLKKGLLDAAQRGSYSPHKSTSPISTLLDPSRL